MKGGRTGWPLVALEAEFHRAWTASHRPAVQDEHLLGPGGRCPIALGTLLFNLHPLGMARAVGGGLLFGT